MAQETIYYLFNNVNDRNNYKSKLLDKNKDIIRSIYRMLNDVSNDTWNRMDNSMVGK